MTKRLEGLGFKVTLEPVAQVAGSYFLRNNKSDGGDRNRFEEGLMFRRAFQLLIACLVASAVWAATDPFVGQWKLNASRSKLTDEMKVASAGPNTYAFDFGSGKPEVILADGTDQPAAGGTTFCVTVEGPNTWKLVRKQKGRTQLSGIWNLSKDGNTLKDDIVVTRPDGSTYNLDYVYKRRGGVSGFAGTWESVSEKTNLVVLLQIQPYEGNGLTFIIPKEETTNVKLDGKENPSPDAGAAPGSTYLARRLSANTLDFTNKTKGTITDTQQMKLSADLKTLTVTVHIPGRNFADVYVYERQ